MTEAERMLLLVVADTVLIMARNPMAVVDTARLTEARKAVDDEAFRLAPLRPEPADVVLQRAAEALRLKPTGPVTYVAPSGVDVFCIGIASWWRGLSARWNRP